MKLDEYQKQVMDSQLRVCALQEEKATVELATANLIKAHAEKWIQHQEATLKLPDINGAKGGGVLG